jgi:hypothetical protein
MTISFKLHTAPGIRLVFISATIGGIWVKARSASLSPSELEESHPLRVIELSLSRFCLQYSSLYLLQV